MQFVTLLKKAEETVFWLVPYWIQACTCSWRWWFFSKCWLKLPLLHQIAVFGRIPGARTLCNSYEATDVIDSAEGNLVQFRWPTALKLQPTSSLCSTFPQDTVSIAPASAPWRWSSWTQLGGWLLPLPSPSQRDLHLKLSLHTAEGRRQDC